MKSVSPGAGTARHSRISGDGRPINAYVLRGVIYYEKGEYEPEIGAFDEAIRLDPKAGQAYAGIDIGGWTVGAVNVTRDPLAG